MIDLSKTMPITQEEEQGVQMLQDMKPHLGLTENDQELLLLWRKMDNWSRREFATLYVEFKSTLKLKETLFNVRNNR